MKDDNKSSLIRRGMLRIGLAIAVRESKSRVAEGASRTKQVHRTIKSELKETENDLRFGLERSEVDQIFPFWPAIYIVMSEAVDHDRSGGESREPETRRQSCQPR
jgi:hypothetical protein